MIIVRVVFVVVCLFIGAQGSPPLSTSSIVGDMPYEASNFHSSNTAITEPGEVRTRLCCEESSELIKTDHINKKKYYFGIYFKADFYKAGMYCKHRGMELASIESAEEQLLLEKVLYNSVADLNAGFIWTSGFDVDGEFVWSSSGKPFTYTKWWKKKEFHLDPYNCMAIFRLEGVTSGYEWINFNCSEQNYFACEYYDDKRPGHGESLEKTRIKNDQKDKKKYYLEDTFRTDFYNASMYCKNRGMRLASIESAEEQLLLEQTVNNSVADLTIGLIWTSGSDIDVDGEFVWSSSGKPFSYTKWSKGDPFHLGPFNCKAIFRTAEGYFWTTVNCNYKLYFACEYA